MSEPAIFRLHRRSYISPGIGLVWVLAYVAAAALGLMDFDPRWLLPALGLMVRIIVVATMAVTVTDTQIRARWGWILLSDKSIPLERVQDVEIERTILARILGLTQVEVSSAGGSGNIKLSYLDLGEAERLKATLASHDLAGADATTQNPFSPHSTSSGPFLALHETSLIEIARTQITTAAAAAIAALASLVIGLLITPFAFLGILAAPAFVAFAIGSTYLAYGPGRSTISPQMLKLEQGLLTLRTTNTPLRRIQLLTARSGPVFQILGYERVEYRSADSAEGKGQNLRQVLTPAGPNGALQQLASPVLGVRVPFADELQRFGTKARTTTLVRGTLRMFVTATTLALLGWFAWVVFDATVTTESSNAPGVGSAAATAVGIVIAVTAIAAVISFILGSVRATRSSFGFGVGSFLVRDGVVLLRSHLLPTGKVQAVAVDRSILQRLLGTATLRIDVAGMSGQWPVVASDIDADQALALMQHLTVAACATYLPDAV